MSRGISARIRGDQFIHIKTSEPIYYNTVNFYPSTALEYESNQKMEDELDKLLATYHNCEIVFSGTKKSNQRAFGVALFDRPDRAPLAVIKRFTKLKMDSSLNAWDNQTGIPNYKFNSKAAAKTQAGLTPQDILTDCVDLSPESIVSQIEQRFGKESPLTQAAHLINSGTPFPIKIPASTEISFTAFRDYFCELLHPIALHRGTFTGNAHFAASHFLGESCFSGTKIKFGNDKTEGLSDSLMYQNDRVIKISSKGNIGAEASSKNLMDVLRTIDDEALLNKFESEISLIRTIVDSGYLSPLVVATNVGIMSSNDQAMVMSLKNHPLVSADNLPDWVTGNLLDLFESRSPNNPSSINLFYHLLAATAHKVAEYINTNTKFSEAASEILNHSALVQVYTKATENDKFWTINSFDTLWPKGSITGVKFSAQKTYFSTGCKGNFTFKILRT